jgi:acetyl-CoA C-acetyltransferase
MERAESLERAVSIERAVYIRESIARGTSYAQPVIDDRLPVIVATGQVLERDEIVAPMELMGRAGDLAFADAPRLRDRVQHVSVVNVLSGVGPAPATELSDRLGLDPERKETTAVGGNTPQWLVSRLADAIWSGELDVALIAGGEAQRSARVGSADEKRARWSLDYPGGDTDQADPVVGEERLGFGHAESGAGLLAPVHVYPLFESAIAHRTGRTFSEQRDFLGGLLAPFTKVASGHRCAWFPVVRSPAEISEPSPENRLVCEPYPKLMCAFLGVDQAATVLICSYGAAKSAGVADSSIFCWSGADAHEVWFPSARPDLGRSPGLLCAGNAALQGASVGIDDIALLDFYSCFPCVVEMACDAFGVALDDPRGLTVTGGLPYFGGPGNSYTLHAIATMVELLRSANGSTDGSANAAAESGGSGSGNAEIGLVSGIGWYATKHSVGVYGSSPAPFGWRRGPTDSGQAEIDAAALPVVPGLPEGGVLATVDASTIAYDGSGLVTGAPLIATLDDGRRVCARASESVALAELHGGNLAGERVLVSGSPPRYTLT